MLISSPRIEKGISAMMLGWKGIMYAYFKYAYKRTGTLWEGRHKSCLVEVETYLLELYLYIELNPVYAGMDSDS